jgi:tRNA pseudouridine55 synthase
MLTALTSFEEVDFVKGSLILVDKPKDWTSFDVVNKIKNVIRRKYDLKKIKVGHSGTLDPMATGLLLVCTGSMTKELFQLQGLDKKYTAEITLGIETNTYDAEGDIISENKVPELSISDFEKLLSTYIGDITQIPPAFSAIKKDGKPLYALARAGKEVIPDPRQVKVYNIRIIDFKKPKLTIEVHSGSGFYVRSLAHDIGAAIGCGAHLSALERTAVGEYQLKDAFQLNDIVSSIS